MGGQGRGDKCISEDGWTVSWMISEVIGMGGQGGGEKCLSEDGWTV